MGMGEDEALVPYQNRSIAGGVNTRFFALDIDDQQSVQLQNIDGTTPGLRETREGTLICATGITYGPILALSEYRGPEADQELLAISPGGSAGDNFRLWRWDGVDTQFDLLGALTGYTGYESTSMHINVAWDASMSAGHVAVISQEGDDVNQYKYTWDGTTLTTATFGISTRQPTGPVLTFAGARLFAKQQNDGALRNRMMFSYAGNWASDLDFSSVRALVFGGGTGQDIVAAEPFRSQDLVVWMSDRIEFLTMSDGDLVQGSGGANPALYWGRGVIDTTIGCGSRKSIATAGEDKFFADQYGNIRSLARTITDASQGTRSLPVSDPIDYYIKQINPQYRHRIVGAAYDRWYIVGFPLGSADRPDHVFAFDTVRRAWDGPWTNLNPYAMAVATLGGATDSDDKNPTLYIGMGTTAAGIVIQWPRGVTDENSSGSSIPIAHQEVTKRLHWGSLETRKTGRFIDVYAVAGSVTLTIEANVDAKGWQTIGAYSMASDNALLPLDVPFVLGGSSVKKVRAPLNLEERFTDIQFRFTATASDTFQMLGYSVMSYIDNLDWEVT